MLLCLLVSVVQVISRLVIVGLVLLQHGKGADMGHLWSVLPVVCLVQQVHRTFDRNQQRSQLPSFYRNLDLDGGSRIKVAAVSVVDKVSATATSASAPATSVAPACGGQSNEIPK